MFKTKIRPAALASAELRLSGEGFTRQAAQQPIRGIYMLLALAMMLTLMLPGCGPGTGGTGVGPVTSVGVPSAVLFGGTATVALQVSVASGLTPIVTPVEPASAPVAVPVPGPLPCIVNCVATTLPTAVTLLVEAERIVLQGTCLNFIAQTPLASAVGGITVQPGIYQTFSTRGGQTANTSVPATLELQFPNGQTDSPSVTASVRDNAGALLVGPASLLRVSPVASETPVDTRAIEPAC